MSADERRLKEANECIQKAKEHLKTSLWKMKTKPDYDMAAYEYARAAVCFRNANRLDLCKDNYLEEAKCYNATKNLFHEAKAKENAAMACRDAKDYEIAQQLYSECVDDYFASGSITTAAQTLDKAAKMLEPIQPESAIQLYEKGLTFVSNDEVAKTAINFYNRLMALYLKLGKFDEARRIACNSIVKFCEINEFARIGNMVLAMALIELKLGDSVAANKSIDLMPTSIMTLFTGELNALRILIRAYDDCDDDAFQNCLKNSVWRAMDNEYLRLMKTLKAPSGGGCITGTSDSSAIPTNVGDDDEEEDIC